MITTRIDYAKKELAALRITNRSTFVSEPWEKEWMMNALRAAFRWAELHSDSIDPDAPFAIVRARRTDIYTN